MFRWGTTAAHSIPELTSAQDCDSLLNRDVVIVFKHSPACAVSWIAHAQVNQFLKAGPQVPVYLISVRQRRDLARYITERTGVEHASPQVIVLRRGQVIAALSHEEITSELLVSVLEAECRPLGINFF